MQALAPAKDDFTLPEWSAGRLRGFRLEFVDVVRGVAMILMALAGYAS